MGKKIKHEKFPFQFSHQGLSRLLAYQDIFVEQIRCKAWKYVLK